MTFIIHVNRDQNLRIKSLSLKRGNFTALHPSTFLRTFRNPLNTYLPLSQRQWTLWFHFLKQVAIKNKQKKTHDIYACVITIKNRLDSVVQFDSRQQYPPRPANQLTRDLWEHNTASTPPLCWNHLTFSYFPQTVSLCTGLNCLQQDRCFGGQRDERIWSVDGPRSALPGVLSLPLFYLLKWFNGS